MIGRRVPDRDPLAPTPSSRKGLRATLDHLDRCAPGGHLGNLSNHP